MIYFSSVCVRCSKLTRPSSGTSESVERRGKLLFCYSRDIFCLAFYAARFIHIRYFFLWLHHCVLLCVLLVFSPFIRVLSTTKKRRILIKTPPPLLQWLFLGFQHSTLRKLKIFFFRASLLIVSSSPGRHLSELRKHSIQFDVNKLIHFMN